MTAAVLAALLLASGCLGIFAAKPPVKTAAQAVRVSAGPDKCTRCHEAWSRAFDYYRGWDRYGCIFDGGEVTGYYDPWLFPNLRNTVREYYTTLWWDTPDTYVWPNNIAERAFSMSILAGRRKLPDIPENPKSVKGKVIVVSKTGDGDTDSIQKAIALAVPGAVVYVRSGVYNEVLFLKEGIRLIGENAFTTIIDPGNLGHGITAANNCQISGFTFTGTGIDYVHNRMNAGIHVPGCDSTLVIMGNIFRENGLFGVMAEGAPDTVRNEEFDRTHPGITADYADRPYLSSANPVIAGNTFYRIGQRAVFLLHGNAEIFNNVFIGNVKTIGMERHSRPFIHHNVFYLNNIPMAINRSEPIICNNIMYRNQWGQRILKGSNPAIFGNVTWESPHFRDFDESGNPLRYRPIPGNGEQEVDPLFVDPPGGDFHFKSTSPFQNQAVGITAVGIMRDPDLPQPPRVACEESFGREVLSLTDDIIDLIRKVDAEQAKIQSVEAAYRIEYTGWIAVNAGPDGVSPTVEFTGDTPAVRMSYEVSQWTARGNTRAKTFHERVECGEDVCVDAGAVQFNGGSLAVNGSRLSGDFPATPDARFIGDRPFRETPRGIYRDYDQYYRGSAGPMGTFFQGYLRVLGGKIAKDRVDVDGRSCIVVKYPHIGNDQYYSFFLDPKNGFRPMRMEEYYGGKPYRVIDSYRYKEFPGNISMPVSVRVTDYAVAGSHSGKRVGEWKLEVNERSLLVNGKSQLEKR